MKPFANTFDELLKKLEDNQQFFKMEFITKDEKGGFELQKVKLQRDHLIALAALEKEW